MKSKSCFCSLLLGAISSPLIQAEERVSSVKRLLIQKRSTWESQGSTSENVNADSIEPDSAFDREDTLEAELPNTAEDVAYSTYRAVMNRFNALRIGSTVQPSSRKERQQAFEEAKEKAAKAEEYFHKAQQKPNLSQLGITNRAGSQSRGQKLKEKGLSWLYASSRQLYESGLDGPKLLRLIGAIMVEEDTLKDSHSDLNFARLGELERLKKQYSEDVILHARNNKSEFQLFEENKKQSIKNRLIKESEDGSQWLMSQDEYGRLQYESHSSRSRNTANIKQVEARVQKKIAKAQSTMETVIAIGMDPVVVERAKEYFVDAALEAGQYNGNYPHLIEEFGKTIMSRKPDDGTRQERLEALWDKFVQSVQQGEQVH